jgi:hypothetical protein
MSDEVISWQAKLDNEISGPAKEIERALAGVSGNVHELDKELKKLDQAQKLRSMAQTKDPLERQIALLRLAREQVVQNTHAWKDYQEKFSKGAEGSALESLKNIAWFEIGKEGAESFLHVLEKVVDKLGELGEKAFEASTQRASLTQGLDFFVGRGRGAGTLEALQGVDQRYGLNRNDSARQQQRFAAMGLTPEQRTRLALSTTQISLLRGGAAEDFQTTEGGMDQLARFARMGYLPRRAMMGMASSLGVDPNAVYAQLGAQRGISGDAAMKLANSRGGANGFKTDEILGAFSSVMNQMVAKSGQTIDELADKSVYALRGRINSGLEKLVEDMNRGPILDLMRRTAEALDPEKSDVASKLHDQVTGLTDELAKMFTIAGPNDANTAMIALTITAFETKKELHEVREAASAFFNGLRGGAGDTDAAMMGVKAFNLALESALPSVEMMTFAGEQFGQGIRGASKVVDAHVTTLRVYRDMLLEILDAVRSLGNEAGNLPGLKGASASNGQTSAGEFIDTMKALLSGAQRGGGR